VSAQQRDTKPNVVKMIVLTPLAPPSTSILGASAMGGFAAYPPAALHDRAPGLSSSPPLGTSPASRSHSVHVCATAYCPPKSGTRTTSSSSATTRFAPALTKRKTGRRRGGSGSSSSGDDADNAWGDYDVWSSGPWDGFEDFGGGSGGGRGSSGSGGRGGWNGGAGGWDRSNSEFGDWGPALAGAGWVWQGICAASLMHSIFFLLFPSGKAAQPAVAPFSAERHAEGLC